MKPYLGWNVMVLHCYCQLIIVVIIYAFGHFDHSCCSDVSHYVKAYYHLY